MNGRHTDFLDLAAAAASRGDYLSAMQYGLRAVSAPRGQAGLRCDAQMLLAIVSLQLGDGPAALAYGVGAHLAACYAGDEQREEKAAAIVATVIAQHPYVGEAPPSLMH